MSFSERAFSDLAVISTSAAADGKPDFWQNGARVMETLEEPDPEALVTGGRTGDGVIAAPGATGDACRATLQVGSRRTGLVALSDLAASPLPVDLPRMP